MKTVLPLNLNLNFDNMTTVTKLLLFLVGVNIVAGGSYLKMHQKLHDRVYEQMGLDQQLEDLIVQESTLKNKIKEKQAEKEKALSDERERQQKSEETQSGGNDNGRAMRYAMVNALLGGNGSSNENSNSGYSESSNKHNWTCAYCGKMVQKSSKPNESSCSVGYSINQGSTSHAWCDIGECGNNTYECSRCHVTVNSKGMPNETGRGEGCHHNWEKL